MHVYTYTRKVSGLPRWFQGLLFPRVYWPTVKQLSVFVLISDEISARATALLPP